MIRNIYIVVVVFTNLKMVYEKGEEINSEKGAWNAAQDTLKRLSEIIKIYRELAIGLVNHQLFSPDTPENQKRMHRTAKMFLVESAPLLSDEQELKALATYKSIPLRYIKREGKMLISFDPNINYQLDSFLIQVQNYLQAKGYFMPDADDEGLF